MVQLNRQYDRENNSGEPIHVKVVGVGGAGSNILDRVMLDGIEAADLVAINTDVQSLTASVAAHKVQLGRNLTRGLGSGGDPELGYAAAEEATDEIRSVLQGGTVIFLCTGTAGPDLGQRRWSRINCQGGKCSGAGVCRCPFQLRGAPAMRASSGKSDPVARGLRCGGLF